MLILYRTNPGFAGRIIAISSASAAEIEAWLAESLQAAGVAYIEADDRLLDAAMLRDLHAHRGAWTVDPESRELCRDGQPTNLGPAIAAARQAREDLETDVDLARLIRASDSEFLAWAQTKSAAQVALVIRRALVRLGRLLAVIQ